MKLLPAFTNMEKVVKKYAIVFTVIVMYQGLFGGMSLSTKPKAIEMLKNNIFFKYFTLFCIAFTATKDIEISLISLCVFVILINVLRTDEERKKHGIFNI